MNKSSIIQKIACWAGYCLFAAYSAYMTAKSVAMSFELNQTWLVFVFVFVVAVIAGYCLSMVIGEMQNRFNPSKSKFVLGLLGFLLFWGVSFATNVHYMLMSNEGLNVVNAELGTYKNYVEETVRNNKDGIKEKEAADIALCEASVQNLTDNFKRECESSIRYGFGDRAIGYLKDIEDYFTNSGGKFDDKYSYKNSIFDEDKDKGDKGKTGAKEVMALKEKYSIRIAEILIRRESIIRGYYKRMIPQTKDLELIKQFINDSLYVVDIPQITEIATSDVYYQFSKIQLTNNIFHRLDKMAQVSIEHQMKESKTDDSGDIDKGKYRYRTYPSFRMFSTFNVWDDMLHNRLPNDMKLLGWILFSLIIDIVAYVLRILAR
ncbi:hypothetical protein [Phocaeicola sp.]|uniref:hypothetical protein n=1 Tax=Phocaeicola sp. TaxID=2773926 RepID=UPI0023C13E89|nr:hypothetical protein [Phocaeicola sp.]MDE5677706.1 hypothetical protein [Phocaeicola sp.]